MTDTRYYIVGDHDAWMVDYEVAVRSLRQPRGGSDLRDRRCAKALQAG